MRNTVLADRLEGAVTERGGVDDDHSCLPIVTVEATFDVSLRDRTVLTSESVPSEADGFSHPAGEAPCVGVLYSVSSGWRC